MFLYLAAVIGCDGSPADHPAGFGDADGDHWSEYAGDCDDEDPDVHPEAIDSCLDAEDFACDGEPYCDQREPDETWSVVDDVYQDVVPHPIAVGDLEGDGVDEVFAKAVEGYDLYVWSPIRTIELSQEGTCHTPKWIEGAGFEDLDADGYDDLVIWNPYCPDDPLQSDNAVRIVSGSGIVNDGITDTVDALGLLTSQVPEDISSPRIVPDMDDDGIKELVVSVWDTYAGRGLVKIVEGEQFEANPTLDAGDASATLLTMRDYACCSEGIPVGDVDGDGLDDLAVTAGSDTYFLSGETLPSLLGVPGEQDIADLAPLMDLGGASFYGAHGDFDDDGLDDFFVSDGTGFSIYLGPGVPSGTSFGPASDGTSLSSAYNLGDLDARGGSELGFHGDASGGSSLFVFTSPHVATGGAFIMDEADGAWWYDDYHYARHGDFDGDGFEDLLYVQEDTLKLFYGPI